jgi:hypothetical protein
MTWLTRISDLRRHLIILSLLMPLAACGLFVSKETRALRKSPDYRAGYNDGCNSAYGPDADKRHDDTIVRDDAMYKDNKAYRMGWGRGLNACRSSGYTGANLPGTVPSGPIPDLNPGNGGLPRP